MAGQCSWRLYQSGFVIASFRETPSLSEFLEISAAGSGLPMCCRHLSITEEEAEFKNLHEEFWTVFPPELFFCQHVRAAFPFPLGLRPFVLLIPFTISYHIILYHKHLLWQGSCPCSKSVHLECLCYVHIVCIATLTLTPLIIHISDEFMCLTV